MRKLLILIAALLLSVGVLLFAHHVLHVNVFAISLRAVGESFLSALRWCRVFLKKMAIKTFSSLFVRRLFRPIFTLLGITWAITYCIDFVKSQIFPRANLMYRFARMKWRRLPWYMRATTLGVVLLVAIVLGFGLWLIPVGAPFYSRLFTRVHVIWTDSWIRRKTSGLARRIEKAAHERKKRRGVREYRNYRAWITKRHKKYNNWADRKIVRRRRELG